MSYQPAEWLLIRYRVPNGAPAPMGIALYVFATDELFIEFREDLGFIDADDLEVVAESGDTLINMAMEMGARETFDWMSDHLSNSLFVEGPHSVTTDDPKATIADLFKRHCQPTPE